MATLKSVCLERRGCWWLLVVVGGVGGWWVVGLGVRGLAVSYEDETLVFSRCSIRGRNISYPAMVGMKFLKNHGAIFGSWNLKQPGWLNGKYHSFSFRWLQLVTSTPPTFGTLMYVFGGKMMKQFKVYFFSLAHAKPPGIGKTLPKN